MIKRVVDISQQSYLHVKNKQLLVDRDGETIAQISIEDLGILILQHQAIVLTQSVVSQCQHNNVAILFCDSRHLPISITLPLWEGNSLHTKVLREQMAVSVPTRKRLWQKVVKYKISEQATTLQLAGANAKGLQRLQEKVKSGDPDNCEAQAAKQYWGLLMGKNFRRDPDAEGVNALLNYGYSIVRAMTARALVGAGLHPAIGLHHKNQYNSLCLADDVMEPFRPWVDWRVWQLLEQSGDISVNQNSKQCLLSLLSDSVVMGDRQMPLMVAAHSLAAGLKRALTDSKQSLVYPVRAFG